LGAVGKRDLNHGKAFPGTMKQKSAVVSRAGSGCLGKSSVRDYAAVKGP
jgi:hypothetical protein